MVNKKVMKRARIILLSSMMISALLAGCGGREKTLEEIQKGGFTVSASVHDPSIIVGEDGKYYIFGSHMEGAVSEDLRQWKSFATGVDEKNPLFDNLFGTDYRAFDYVGKNDEGGYSVWAPDVIYNKAMGKYVMYFCTTSSYVKSNLCFATADKIEGPYTYVDTILYSGFNRKTVLETNFNDIMGEGTPVVGYVQNGAYNHSFWPNCIDPSLFYDADGKMWMTYGSWSGGIFILEIDEQTGYPIHPEADEENGVDTYFGKHLLGGLHNSVEGPYILYDEISGYYYLFVSYGSLVSDGGYQIRVFRSIKPDGVYEDAAGETMGFVIKHEKYGVKMMGNYGFPSLTYTYMAPGHNSAFTAADGKLYVVYHQRFKDGTEYHEPRVHQMFVTKEGWLAAAPFATAGEVLRDGGYKTKEVKGTYYMVNHGTDISNKVHKVEEIVLDKGEIISGAQSGTYILDTEKPYITIQLAGVVYEGVVIEMNDEAGNETICFSAVGSNNETIWGVHYK